MEIPGCRATGHEIDGLDITGYLIPWDVEHEDRPILWRLPGGAMLLPVFSTEAKLRAAMAAKSPGRDFRIKAIDEPVGFLESVAPHAVVGVDPRDVGGRTRFLAIELEGE